MTKISVLGAGSWGTALALLLAKNGHDVILWGRNAAQMQAMQQEHKAIYQGLGGSFDVYTEKINRAPKFWIDANLEWAYRLFKEPSRIKRQITYIPFLIKLILNKL